LYKNNLKIGSFQVKLLLRQGTDDSKEGLKEAQQEDEQLATLTGQQPGTKKGQLLGYVELGVWA
jgi:hypothetical protein